MACKISKRFAVANKAAVSASCLFVLQATCSTKCAKIGMKAKQSDVLHLKVDASWFDFCLFGLKRVLNLVPLLAKPTSHIRSNHFVEVMAGGQCLHEQKHCCLYDATHTKHVHPTMKKLRCWSHNAPRCRIKKDPTRLKVDPHCLPPILKGNGTPQSLCWPKHAQKNSKVRQPNSQRVTPTNTQPKKSSYQAQLQFFFWYTACPRHHRYHHLWPSLAEIHWQVLSLKGLHLFHQPSQTSGLLRFCITCKVWFQQILWAQTWPYGPLHPGWRLQALSISCGESHQVLWAPAHYSSHPPPLIGRISFIACPMPPEQWDRKGDL